MKDKINKVQTISKNEILETYKEA